MMSRQTLDDAIRTALLRHADTAHLPLSVAHVRAQAAVAARAAQAWSAAQAVNPADPFRTPAYTTHPQKPLPDATDLPPERPTGESTACYRDGCVTVRPTVGWRWYVGAGWQAVCTRHMAGAARLGRRYNSEYQAVAS
ncbi:hypothetical protein ABH931_006098 [Streptacidiphilus sp. MAP12-33]|uniref:hypothetical protein n=1 Tax=Streptacidiphilus sp. MAP12-33 TaxID=3156266 RepID=UPI0035173417